MTIHLGKPFWTFVWTFALNMVGLFGVDSVDVFEEPIVINNWIAATVLSLLVALGVYAKAKADEINGKGEH